MAHFATACPLRNSSVDSPAQRGILAHCGIDRFDQQPTHHGVALFADGSSLAVRVDSSLDSAQITGDLFAASKTSDRTDGQTKASESPDRFPDGHQEHRIWPALGLFQNRAIQLRDSRFELVEQFQKFFAPSAGPRASPKCTNSTRPFLVNNFSCGTTPRSWPVRAVGCPAWYAGTPACDDARVIAAGRVRRVWDPILESVSSTEIENQQGVALVGFCLRTSLARILAESPIHSSWPSSANIRSNQRIGR